MNSREQTLALVLLGTIVLFAAGAGGYFFVWQPLQKQRAAEATLNGEIADLEAQVAAQRATTEKLRVARVRSLPADEALARREYTIALERMIEMAGVPKGYTISPKAVDNSARAVPELSKGKPIYTKVAYEVVLKKVDTWMIKDFFEQYYRLGLLHQITNLTIKKDEENNAAKKKDARNDLTVILTTEAILVDGADSRRTLLPVPTAFAAIGGGAIYKGMTLTPEAGRGVSPHVQVPVLATRPRDYSVIVRKDPFSGPLYDPKPEPFQIAKIGEVKVEADKAPLPVKVELKGDGRIGAKVIALASGSLFAEGALKVEPKTSGSYTIELPKTSATEGTATISVIATSTEGKTEKTSFKVSLAEEPKVVVDPGETLEQVILLIGVTPRSDGTAWARIVDNANRYRYQIDATPKEIKVIKETTWGPDRPWKADSDHAKLPAGVMELSAYTKMTRTFKLIAVNHDGLILADIKPGGTTTGKPEVMGKGGAAKPPKQPANPLAAVGGNVAVAVPTPKYYRWPVGHSLAAIKPLPADEVKQILKTAEASGPVLDAVVGR